MPTQRTSRPRRVRLRALLGVVLALCALAAAACGNDDEAAGTTSTTAADAAAPRVVASTSWAGAYAQLAGIDDVVVIAPADLQHPPDYDPRPSDLTAVADADYVVYAGFESFADRLVEASGSDAELIEVNLDNSVENITAEVERLAAEFGTESVAEERLADLTGSIEEIAAEVDAARPDPAPVTLSHQFMTSWADFAGLDPVATFGPAPPTAAELVTLAEHDAELVIDNGHGPSGAALADGGAAVVEMHNFPGEDLDLVPVFRQNADAFIAAFAG